MAKHCFLVLCYCAVSQARGQDLMIHWATQHDIRISALDGTGTEIIRQTNHEIEAFGMPRGSSDFYYAVYDRDVFASRIYRRGSPVTGDLLVADVEGTVVDFAFDMTNAKLYWTQRERFRMGVSGLFRSDLDGSSVEALGSEFIGGVDVDPEAGRIYVARNPPGNPFPEARQIIRMNLDGSDQTVLHAVGLLSHNRIKYHPGQDKLYFTFNAVDTYWLQRMDTDGNHFERVPVPDTNAFDFDPLTDEIYGARYYYATFRYDLVRFMSDGSGYETLLSNPPRIRGIAVREAGVTVPVLDRAGLILLMLALLVSAVWLRRKKAADLLHQGGEPAR